jgi:peptidoglycan/xylan/chitin deacetylase (PgdA/CDA1 family)
LKHRIAAALFSTIRPSLLGRLTGANPAFLFYHLISDADVPHVRHLYRYKTIRQFREDIDYLLRHYRPISLADVLEHVRRAIPLPDHAFMLSFDDGFREMHEVVAPILLEKGVPATFFLNSDFIDNRHLCFLHKSSILAGRVEQRAKVPSVEGILNRGVRTWSGPGDFTSYLLSIPYEDRGILNELARRLDVDFDAYLRDHAPYLTSDQIRGLLRDGFAIGSHSIDHPLYGSLDLEEQLRQTLESIRAIRERFALAYGVFAFPYNDHGVSREFFRRLGDSGEVEITFGTSGMVEDCVARHLQRLSLEKPPMPAEKIVALEYGRKLYRMAKGKDRVIRT